MLAAIGVLAGFIPAMMASRLAVGRQSLGDAVSRAAAALDAARTANEPGLLAAAACAAAFAHLAVGDHSSIDRDVAVGLPAARLAHDPVRALKMRLIAAESARRTGRTGLAAALLRRMGRVSRVEGR